MEQKTLILIALAGFWAALILFKLGIYAAHRVGLVDTPDAKGGRKNHEGAIPLIGGLIIVPVFAVMSYAANLPDLMLLTPLFGGVILLLVMGALDDKFHIHPWARFVLQIWLACYVVVFCHGDIENLGNLYGFGDVHLGWFAPFFAVICLVLLMNAINMLDGVDGLAGGFVAVALGWLMVAAYNANFMIPFWAMLYLLIPLLAFLVFNARHPFRAKAAAFMGDAGSLSLALILGWFAIKLAQVEGENQIFPAVTIIWIMSVPIMDTFAIFFVRMKQGRSPFDADRLHGHYKLIDKGIPAHFVAPLIWGVAVITGAIGYFGVALGVPQYVLLYSWSAILLGYTFWRIRLDGGKQVQKP